MKHSPARPLWRLEDLLSLCFQPEELHRSLSRRFPLLAPELPPMHESAAQFAHAVVALLERHGSIDAPLFAHLLASRPLRRAQIMSAACALAVDSAAIESLIADGEATHVFRSPTIVEPKLVDALEDLVLERERASPDDPRRLALSEDIEHLAAQIRTRRPPRAGERIAGTILEYQLGRGTFGSVWRSRDAETGEPRATKIFDTNRLTEGIMLWRFRRSIHALQTLNKYRGAPTSIARVFSVAEDGLAFAMELLTQGSLENVAQRGWSLGTRLETFVEICRAVAFAHHAGVVHRDIKPTNVMFDANLRPVLIDFDIADIQFLTEQKLTTGGLGTPMFAAPEQIECAGEIDERADVYSLGRLLHYMLIERVPTYTEQGDLMEHLARFPPSLSYTVRKATQRDPADRFMDVDRLRREVEVYKTGTAALRANVHRGLYWLRRHAAGVMLASSAISGALVYAKHQEVQASTHLREVERYEDVTAHLHDIQRELDDARRIQEDLRGRLDEATARLLVLERSDPPLDPQVMASRRGEMNSQIDSLQARLKEAEQRLNSVHDELSATLSELDRVREPQPPAPPEPKPAPFAAKPEAIAAPPAPPQTPSASQAAARPRPPRNVPPLPVDLLTRQNEVRAAAKRLQPKIQRCRGKYTTPGSKAGFMVKVDAAGTVIRVGRTWGDISEHTRECVVKLLSKQRFMPMKPDSQPSVGRIEFAFE